MLKIIYTSLIFLINILYYFTFGAVIRQLGFVDANNTFYRGAVALLIFNSGTFLVSLLFFKEASRSFKLFNNILYTVLLIVSFLPIAYTILPEEIFRQ